MAELFVLMNKDVPVLKFEADASLDSFAVVDRTGTGPTAPLPLGFGDIQDFLAHRRALKHRAHIARLLALYQCDTLYGYLRVTHALSLNDTFWCKPADSGLNWRQVSLFTNNFDEVIARTAFEGGLHGEAMSTTSPEFGTDGSFAKCWIRRNGQIYLLKTGSRGPQQQSLEPYSEILAHQVARALDMPAVEYSLVWRYDRTVGSNMPSTVCPLFTTEDVGFVPATRYLGSSASSVTALLDAYTAIGAGDAFRRMVVLGALILNPYRHMGNHGVCVDNATQEPVRMAPVFDNNMALCPGLSEESLSQMGEWAAQNLRPRIGGDFNLVAHQLLTPAIRRRLKDMGDFSFDRTKVTGMSDERLDALERLVRSQARAVRAGTPFNKTPEPSADDLSWQIEGWSD